MLTKREEQFLEDLEKWAQSIGINLDRDPEQLQFLSTHFVK